LSGQEVKNQDSETPESEVSETDYRSWIREMTAQKQCVKVPEATSG
jgi:hypothetical protein